MAHTGARESGWDWRARKWFVAFGILLGKMLTERIVASSGYNAAMIVDDLPLMPKQALGVDSLRDNESHPSDRSCPSQKALILEGSRGRTKKRSGNPLRNGKEDPFRMRVHLQPTRNKATGFRPVVVYRGKGEIMRKREASWLGS